MKTVRSFTCDSLLRRTLGSRDSRLTAIELKRICDAGRRWINGIGSQLDPPIRDMLAQIDSAFTVGRVLEAQVAEKTENAVGRAWLGRLSQAAKAGDESATASLLREADADPVAFHPVEHERSETNAAGMTVMGSYDRKPWNQPGKPVTPAELNRRARESERAGLWDGRTTPEVSVKPRRWGQP